MKLLIDKNFFAQFKSSQFDAQLSNEALQGFPLSRIRFKGFERSLRHALSLTPGLFEETTQLGNQRHLTKLKKNFVYLMKQ